jgi:branched-chain amino acid transport system substrate-binding protein
MTRHATRAASPRRRARLGGLIALLALTAVAVAASTASSATSKTSYVIKPHGLITIPAKAQKARGSAIKIGMINQETSATTTTFPDLSAGARAAIAYIDNFLDGLNGHVLSLNVCQTQGTVDSAATCANQFVDAKLPAVLQGIDTTGAANGILTGAGIPFLGESPALLGDITTPGMFEFTGGTPATYGAVAQFYKRLGKKNVVIFYLGTAGGAAAINNFAKPYFKNVGIAMTPVPVPVGAADVTPALQLGLGNNPDGLLLVGDSSTCINMLRGLQTLGKLSIPHAVGITCSGKDVQGAVGSAFDKIYTLQPLLPDSSPNPEVKLYRAAMKRYSPTTDTNAYAKTGFALVMNTWRVLSGIKGAITTKSVSDAVRAATDDPSFMPGGGTFNCSGKYIDGYPGICGTYTTAGQFVNGAFKAVMTLNSAPALK